MEKARCPFLELTTVTFCKAFPVKKMIPVDKSTSDKGVCNSATYRECPAYREINSPEVVVENVRGFLLKPDVYFHPRHLWASMPHESDGEAKIGIDDFSQKLIGKIDRVSVPPEGSAVRENGICLLLHSGARTARMVAPADGVIRSINRKVASDPSLVNRDPYGEGWILSMHVTGEGIKRLFHGSVARKWFDWEVERLQRMFSADLGIGAYSTLGVGLASIVTAGVFHGLALGQQTDANAAGQRWDSAQATLANSRYKFNVAYAMYGVGGAALATSIILFVVDVTRERKPGARAVWDGAGAGEPWGSAAPIWGSF